MYLMDKLKTFIYKIRNESLFRNEKKIKIIILYLSKCVFNILALIFLIIGRNYYIKSLLGCDGEEFKCIIKSDMKYIFDDIYYCIHSAIFFFIFLFLLHLKLCSFYLIFIFILIIFELIYKATGDSFLHHGILNLSALIIFLVLGECFNLVLILTKYLFKKKKFYFLSQLFIFIFFLNILIYINIKNKYYCKDWAKGLNGTYINNDKIIYSCSINIPKERCLINILSPILDFTKLLRINCNNRVKNEKYLLIKGSNLDNTKKINKINKIGYPITIGEKKEIKGTQAMYSRTLLKFFKNNLINLDEINKNHNLESKKPEVYVDFSNGRYGKLNIQINYSDKLSKQRNSLIKNKDSNNILFIFLDSISRVHFYRQFKKTSHFIKKFLTFKGFSTKDDLKQKYHGFEFIKYHSFAGATIQNSIPMFSGVYFDKQNEMVSIVKKMKEVGYITANVQDICHKELMAIGNFSKYSYIEFDHEYASPNCDPNVYKYGFGLFSGENGIIRKCLYGKESFEYSLEYSMKFWKAYKNNKKFLRIVNTYGHEYSSEKAKYSDEALHNFLKNLYFTNLLKNTTVFIAGDHGFALMGVYKILNSQDWKIENSLPIFIVLNSDKNNLSYEVEYSEILKNQQNLITPFDIYYTIREIIFGNNYKNNLLKEQNNEGESLFKYISPKERNCSKYKQFSNCQCKSI